MDYSRIFDKQWPRYYIRDGSPIILSFMKGGIDGCKTIKLDGAVEFAEDHEVTLTRQ
jgi:hypothetical protein